MIDSAIDQERKGMKRLFQTWLLVFVIGAFLLTLGISWIVQTVQADKAAVRLLELNMEDAVAEVAHTDRNFQTIIKMSNDSGLSSARMLSEILALNPSIVTNRAALEKVHRELNVDEIHISDENGVLIACVPPLYQGFDLKSTEQSAAFMPAVTNVDFELVQNLEYNGSNFEPMRNGSLNVPVQYIGVARKDRPGVVQIGYDPKRIRTDVGLADVHAVTNNFHIGHNGCVRITDNTDSGSTEVKVFSETVNGMPSLCMSVPCGRYLLTGNLPKVEIYKSRNLVMVVLIVANLILFAVVYQLVSTLLQSVVINGIYSVNASLSSIINGNLEEKVKVRTSSEFVALSQGINKTVSALKKCIENESKRIDSELEMGRTIQASVLPGATQEHKNFRLAAGMFTAKEVGGDFYDFFMIDDRRLAALVADVSGKGITAALYMMNTKSMLKNLIMSGIDPADAFNEANNELCRNNKAHMFVTAFLAVFDLDTETLMCVNAGHNPPLFKRRGVSWEYLRIKHSLVLGVSNKARYTCVPVPVSPGDSLFLYTDGVTEAKGSDGKLFGENRLQETLNATEGEPNAVISEIKSKVDVFSFGVPQSDDITMLKLDII